MATLDDVMQILALISERSIYELYGIFLLSGVILGSVLGLIVFLWFRR